MGALGNSVAALSTSSVVGDIIEGLELTGAFGELVTGVGSIVTDILPLGIGLILVLNIPRIIRRLIGTFA